MTNVSVQVAEHNARTGRRGGSCKGRSFDETFAASLADPSRYRPGGYIRTLPDDPWGRPYQLAVPGNDGAPFEVYSLGADGAPGGEDENADIRGSAD